MKKQNIEDIFSSLENFSSIPPPELWDNIEAELNKPKKKKRAIIWWSAAACLLLGLSIPSVLYINSKSEIKNINTISTEKNNVVFDENSKSTNNKTITPENNNSTKKSAIEILSNKITEDQSDKSSNNTKQETKVAHTNAENQINSTVLDQKSNAEKRAKNQETRIAVTADSKNNSNTVLLDKKRNVAKETIIEKTAVATINPKNKNNSDSTNPQSNIEKGVTGETSKVIVSSATEKSSNSVLEEKLASKNNNNLAYNSSKSSLSDNKNKTNDAEKVLKNETIIAKKNLSDNQKNNSKFGTALSKQDSLQLAELQNLEKGIITPEAKKEKDTKPLSDAEKWAVEVFAGVASSENYRNEKTLGNTNASKQSNSYGVKTKYKVNKRWGLSSGLKINELGQSIANVSYLSTDNTLAFFANSSNTKTENAVNQKISTNSNYLFISNTTTTALKADNYESGNIDQNLKYIEMPLEISYAILSKEKASISLNTGAFVGKLISNNVSLNGNSIGENANANNVVYGPSFSSTLQYRLYKKTNVFVEPAMNYYVNPLNNQTFNQFQWGFNFGLNVNF